MLLSFLHWVLLQVKFDLCCLFIHQLCSCWLLSTELRAIKAEQTPLENRGCSIVLYTAQHRQTSQAPFPLLCVGSLQSPISKLIRRILLIISSTSANCHCPRTKARPDAAGTCRDVDKSSYSRISIAQTVLYLAAPPPVSLDSLFDGSTRLGPCLFDRRRRLRRHVNPYRLFAARSWMLKLKTGLCPSSVSPCVPRMSRFLLLPENWLAQARLADILTRVRLLSRRGSCDPCVLGSWARRFLSPGISMSFSSFILSFCRSSPLYVLG
ncbi:hypothetical protein GE09DRAFT_760492 [Coniochaeta sp. 2T2.1]|nr:hypothetical protein GE09DRAFT_760492 [Coniochaeta sp. 2T2.1]